MAPLPPPISQTVQKIYESYTQDRREDYRPHLGASEIGHPCERALWLTFRWATKPDFGGRQLRLFETGNLEEYRFKKELRRIGVTVMDVDPSTGRQWSVSAIDGHFGGSMDAVGLGIPEALKTWHLLEFKTHNEKSFQDLKKNGLFGSKPQHLAQMLIYMFLGGLERGLYLAVNKNTDELYAERVKLDKEEADRILRIAEKAIMSPRPPQRISENPAWYQCKMCNHYGTCQLGGLPEKHCRSCLHSEPYNDGKWFCNRWLDAIPKDVQPKGCHEHLYVPDLIPGKQVDAGDNWVEYEMKDGSRWRNEAGKP